MELFESGKLFCGCNYWASHAGTNMWSDWRPEVIEADFARLAASEIKVLRIFPLWSDFQPLRIHRMAQGQEKEYRLREDPLPHTAAGRAGVDEGMAERFGVFCDLAEAYGIRLIVGLITGWMSGRMHMPEAFAGKKLLSDPVVIRWQTRFVRYMVTTFRDKPAIAAWDLGNECNVMGNINQDEAYLWAKIITDTIKLADPSRPVVSGMHGLSPTGVWTPEDQGEILDILCTHPYPLFTPHCATDPLNQMKSCLHATAESVLYASLGGKPCFVEEIGTLGPMIADEETAADYIRTGLISSWAHDLRGFVWWCAAEQAELTHTPYDWDSVERELGLFRLDGSPKPVANAFAHFARRLAGFSGDKLPERITDAVCILSKGQDIWGVAYGAFILAKQAGLEITFAWSDDEIPVANAYMLPSITTNAAVNGHVMTEILRRVREDGATLYVSLNDALLSPFSAYSGVQVHTRCHRITPDTVTLDGDTFRLGASVRYQLEATTAQVLATDQESRPVFTENAYGAGKVYFCAYPLELDAGTKPGIVSGENAVPLYKFYEKLAMTNPAKTLTSDRTMADAPFVGLTEHPYADGRRAAVLVNYTPEPRTVRMDAANRKIASCLAFSTVELHEHAGSITVTIPGNSGAALILA